LAVMRRRRDQPSPGPTGPKVSAGRDNGLITIALEEADDAKRERRRTQMGEPYRSLHGHFRHDVGRYFWKCSSATVAAWTSAALFSAMTTGTTVRRCRRIIKMARRRTGGSTLSAPVQPLIPDNQDLDPFVLPSPAIAKLTFVARSRAFNAQMAMLNLARAAQLAGQERPSLCRPTEPLRVSPRPVHKWRQHRGLAPSCHNSRHRGSHCGLLLTHSPVFCRRTGSLRHQEAASGDGFPRRGC
jgi:hypothetical protein